MNQHFCEIGKKLQEQIRDTGDAYKSYLPQTVTQTFYLTPVTPEELAREIQKLNPRKAAGYDDIGPKVLKLCPDIIAENLTTIFNDAIVRAKYPTLLKVAKVIALFKKGERHNPHNYRPISLLSSFNKIFEKIIAKRLIAFLEQYNILFDYQYGFRRLYSTTLALIDFSDNIHRFVDLGHYAISIFIDLTKAFDTVNHEILLSKLNSYGIRGHANTFLRSYLSNRTQFTVVNGVRSDHNIISCGVPQGSVLGPLLFSLNINDLYMAVGSDTVRLFADDTVLFMHDPNLNKLINDITEKFTELYNWCVCNKLTINGEKTNFVLFHAINKPVPQNFDQIKTGVMEVTRVKTFQYLGVYFDETLKWNEHVNYVCNSLVKYFGIFNHIKNKVTKPIVRQLYYAFIYSKIKYGIEVYGNTSAKNISRVQVIQNKLLKLILSWDWQTSTNFVHNDLKILKVEDIYKYNILNFVNKCVMGRIPENFKTYYKTKVVPYATRSKGSLDVIPCRTWYGSKAVKVNGALLWNNIHKNIRELRSMPELKEGLLKYYITLYVWWINELLHICTVKCQDVIIWNNCHD